jgi:hypothetical protein
MNQIQFNLVTPTNTNISIFIADKETAVQDEDITEKYCT